MRIVMIATVFAAMLGACQGGTPAPLIADADTRVWWAITGDLSSDAMEGRDTGSPGHARAVEYVVARLKAAGLQPAGVDGGWTQTVQLKEVRVEKPGTSFQVVADGASTPISFLHELTLSPAIDLPASLDAGIAFRGYCSAEEMSADMAGKVAVCFAARRGGKPGGGDRMRNARAAGAVGVIDVDDTGFVVEPARWPAAYARSVTFRDAASPMSGGMPSMRLNSAALGKLIAGSGQDAAALLAAGAALAPLPSFDAPGMFRATFAASQRELESDNVFAMLPGTDAELSKEIVLVSAHLDGYGYGEPVDGDDLYNGAFDDAAYVATLIRLAERQAGKGFRRSILIAVYTGEEKGLLGSNHFSMHPTIARENIVAVINLDQLRPLFPLKILTMHGLDESTLGDSARRVAAAMGIELRNDREPERNLIQRTDHWPFLRTGIPAANFVFGYDPGTEAERRYREWYNVRYHRPQDDMTQPIDFQAAADMNTFFYRMTEDVANADERPVFAEGSRFKPN